MRLKQREYMDLAGKYIRMERPATAEEQECGLPSLIGLETTVTAVEFFGDGGVRIQGDSFDFTLPLDEADAWKFIVWPDEDTRMSRKYAIAEIATILHRYDHPAYDTVAYCTFCHAAAEQALEMFESGKES
jgi:hypothetical protein